ncbi:DUF5675 family protein [Microvirga massiliensis]|uniref:DUF5675 family protein n=1 Tax=Microvirga massiliensis TaxID=1033741 RepID=UPI00062BDD70|nr:DUF5675 family protein [Microvirga massiliensis]
MVDIVFKRTGTVNANGSVPGELTIGTKVWPTIERGGGYTFVRMGEYTLKMDMKATGRKVQCLRFDHAGIRTHLIHDALNDSHTNLEGCIAPGLSSDADGIKQSAEAMKEVWLALGGFTQGTNKTIRVENNITGDETAEAWIRRRQAAGKY